MMILGLVLALHSPLEPQGGGSSVPDEPSTSGEAEKSASIDEKALRQALAVVGLQFTDSELAQMLPTVLDRLNVGFDRRDGQIARLLLVGVRTFERCVELVLLGRHRQLEHAVRSEALDEAVADLGGAAADVTADLPAGAGRRDPGHTILEFVGTWSALLVGALRHPRSELGGE